jgi:hypothetical protein
VAGSTGIADGAARLDRLDGGHIALTAFQAGIVLVRMHYSPHWFVTAGAACVGPTPDGWMAVDAAGPGPVQLQLKLTGKPAPACP